MNPRSVTEYFGVGATDKLSLRVSIATLVRVLFENPKDGTMMLALERKATLLENNGEQHVEVKSQPFGGAMRLLDPDALQKHIGMFHFDSEESRLEQDFRIFIQPEDWEMVQEFCLKHLHLQNDAVLESDPARELTEEFAETLGISLKPDQYRYQAMGTIVEDYPSPTENVHARGYPTTRIYRTFEAQVRDPALASALINVSISCSDQNLRNLALQDFHEGGLGRANAVLALPLNEIDAFYLGLTPEARERSTNFQDHQLDGTAVAILDHVIAPQYRRL